MSDIFLQNPKKQVPKNKVVMLYITCWFNNF